MTGYTNFDLGEGLARCKGEHPPPWFMSDGCTCSPDSLKGVDLRPACHLHDWHYTAGGTSRDRLDADILFYRNLQSLGLSRFWAGIYYRRVRLLAPSHYNWNSGERPRPRWLEFAVNFFLRYLPVRFID